MANASHRVNDGGRLIDRSKPVSFTFDGKTYQGYAGDTLASALLANGVRLVGRSYKYHRPRGILASGAEEPNALINLGEGAAFEPNQRATQIELRNGLSAESQNRWPSLSFDTGALTGTLSRLFPAGFYYKTFIHPRPLWKHVYEPMIRKIAGLGKAPKVADNDRYEHFYYFCDVLVVGGGGAGLMAAKAAAEQGLKVVLVEQTERIGGRLLVDDVQIDGASGADWVAETAAALAAMPNVTILTRTAAAASYDHNYNLLYQRLTDHDPQASGPRHRLWRVRAGKTVLAAGALERPIAFRYNDLPGIMLASAVRDYLALWGVAPGRRAVIYTTNDDGYRTAFALRAAGVDVAAILDSRSAPTGDLPAEAQANGFRVLPATGIAEAKGGKHGVTGIRTTALRGSGRAGGRSEKIDCDLVCMAGGWSPVVHLYSHSGGKVTWDEAGAMFRPDPANPPRGAQAEQTVFPVGASSGALGAAAGLAEAAALFGAAAPAVKAPAEGPIKAVWFTPSFGAGAVGNKHFLDFQHDVTASDIELAAREGYESVEHAKRYTTLGMATDQGKVSNVNGHALLADALGKTVPEVGTTTFRPPYTPISFGAITGIERGPLFKPVRKTTITDWHAANGADWEPIGDWRRPYRYKRGDEDRHASINREILTVREKVGMIDASTLGKIIVKGPDAGEFLDRMYTNMMSTLKPGKCRYGLMCNDNGYLFDDGVVVRLDAETFLCHTTSGGADRVHGWFEEWLQTEWTSLKVYTANVTEQWAQFAVAGPKAREALKALGGDLDLSAEALPFMGFVEGVLGGVPVRIYRISFSGELSYEVATPASFGRALWDKLLEAGAPMGIAPYGTEALHILRAEKGFIAIGDETDGTVTPHDLNLGWAVSKKKPDFIGKRAMERSWPTNPDRWTLVGLYTEDPNVVLPDGAYAVDEVKPNPPMATIGRVTSTYWSPTLKRSIAMGLVARGGSRMGETINFPVGGGKVIKATIVDPVFFDKEGARQNV